jgi:hypothetical protein
MFVVFVIAVMMGLLVSDVLGWSSTVITMPNRHHSSMTADAVATPSDDRRIGGATRSPWSRFGFGAVISL